MQNSFSQQPVYHAKPKTAAIPGLKVAYGAQSGINEPSLQNERPKSWLNRLKKTVVDLVTEEAEADRPIGIAQLSRNTFFAHAEATQRTFVQTSNPMQDYRFRFIAEPRPR